MVGDGAQTRFLYTDRPEFVTSMSFCLNLRWLDAKDVARRFLCDLQKRDASCI
jgi:hypothetical protein